MIKLLEKELRNFRKDTFITSFFSTITILLIVLIICSVSVHAQSVTGGSAQDNNHYEYDTDNYYGIGYYFPTLDITKTNPVGSLYRDGNPNLEQTSFVEGLYAGAYNLSNSYASIESPNNTIDSYLNGQTTFNIPSELTYNGTLYDLTEYKNFLFTTNGQSNYLSLFKSTTVNLTFSSGNLFWIDNSDAIILRYDGPVSNSPTPLVPIQRHINGYGVDDDVYLLAGADSTQALAYANCSVMGDLYEYPNEWERNVSYFSAEYNYLNGQVANGGTSSDNESAENNMYLKSCDFKFNIHKYGDINDTYNEYIKNSSKYTSSQISEAYDFAVENKDKYWQYWGNKSGLIDFEATPTDFQVSHADEFYLYFQFTVLQRFYVVRDSGDLLGHNTFNSINTTTTQTFYTKTYLDDFIDNGNRITWQINNLFDDLKVTAFTSPSITTAVNNSFNQVVGQERELNNVLWLNDNNLGYVIRCTAFLASDTYTIIDAGSYSETYGFCSQVSKNTDSSLTENPNPYTDDNSNNDNTNSSSSTTQGNITLTNYDNDNNNQTVNITSDDAELVDTLTDKFIPSNMDNTGGLTTQFTELANTNGYITFFKNTFSFVPVAVWNTLLVLLGTTCSIIAVAFVIKVLRGM